MGGRISRYDQITKDVGRAEVYAGILHDFDGGVAAERCGDTKCRGTDFQLAHATESAPQAVTCKTCGKPWPLLSYDQLDTPQLYNLHGRFLAERDDERRRMKDPTEPKHQKESAERLAERAEKKRLAVLQAMEGRSLRKK